MDKCCGTCEHFERTINLFDRCKAQMPPRPKDWPSSIIVAKGVVLENQGTACPCWQKRSEA